MQYNVFIGFIKIMKHYDHWIFFIFFIFSAKFLFTHLKILVNGIKLPETESGCIVMIVRLFFALEHDSNSAMASGPAEPTFKGL